MDVKQITGFADFQSKENEIVRESKSQQICTYGNLSVAAQSMTSIDKSICTNLSTLYCRRCVKHRGIASVEKIMFKITGEEVLELRTGKRNCHVQ